MNELKGYDLSRNFINWCFENPELINPAHHAIYFYSIDLCNRLGWKEKFSIPTNIAMETIGISKHQTYIKYFNDLVKWGFIKLVQKSINQHTATVISLNSAIPKNGKAMDKANINHTAKQIASEGTVNKQETNNNETTKNTCFAFEDFWNLYDKKVGKTNTIKLYEKITEAERQLIKEYIPKYKLSKPEVKYRKDPERFLKNRVWEDEIVSVEPEDKTDMFFANGQWHKKTPLQKYH